jgi:hypothetical protein
MRAGILIRSSISTRTLRSVLQQRRSASLQCLSAQEYECRKGKIFPLVSIPVRSSMGCCYTEIAMEGHRFVSRACPVCEWEGGNVEAPGQAVACPWCHAPTRVVREEWLTPAGSKKNPPAAGSGKNPHAAALGRMGGLKGGRVRAERLSPRRRREIARKAAEARWRSR